MTDLFYYCLSCRTGSENDVARDLEQRLGYTAMTPVYQKKERKQGSWYIKRYPMMRGYVFFYSARTCEFRTVSMMHGVYRVLTYDDGTAELAGKDRSFAEWVYDFEGDIGISKVFMADQHIKVLEGPLSGYEGNIVKVDKRKESAMVRFTVGEITRDVWLSYELIAS